MRSHADSPAGADEPPAINGLAFDLRSRFSREEADRMIAFARALFARDGAAYVSELSQEDRVALVASAYRFFAHMTAPVRCRVWNPTFAVDGWDSPYTICESHLTDRPFIVDSVREYLRQAGAVVRHILHPICSVERDREGSVTSLRLVEVAGRKESFLHCVIDRIPDSDLPRLEKGLAERLGDVVLATDDYGAMLERVEAVNREVESYRPRLAGRETELNETREFLWWLARGGFVFLGARSYTLSTAEGRPTLEVDRGSGLGLLRKEERSTYATRRLLDEIPPGAAERILAGSLLIIARTNAESTVHRRMPMDTIGIKRLDQKGDIVGEHRFLGLFTSKAYTEEAAQMPILRGKLQRILAKEQVLPGSHDYKEIVAIFNSIPKTELLTLSVDELCAEIQTILLIRRPEEVRVTLRPDASGRGISVMVILPRERFSGEVRRAIQDLLAERMGGAVVDYQLALGEGEMARLHFYISTPESVPLMRASELEAEIAERVRSWDDRLRERLVARYRGARGRELAARYAALLPDEYKAITDVPTALNDIAHLEELAKTNVTQIDLANGIGEEAERYTTLKLYLRGEPLVLSDFLPLLENLGLRVFAEDSVDLGEGVGRIFLHSFLVQDRRGQRLDVRKASRLLCPAILEILAGRVESDSLNRLVVDAELSWRDVEVLRTYRNLAFQAGAAPSRPALNDALIRHPESARALFEIFAVRFGPDGKDREGREKTARERFLQSLESVETSGEDRMLRNLLALVEATLRTNYNRPVRGEHPYLAVKIHSQAIDYFPKPRPLCEIYVHSARMEGVHLRGGKIARGGIRFSDRHDDFRTEILGLMKTQTVKNAVIVPVGSKGGFIVKRPQPGEEGAKEIRECYSTLIRGLLDLTDNIVQGAVVSPAEVVRYDDDDPYLVVAADKGTATFSDLANSISREYGFWLGDAFASGGSAGYDHKKEGITARGAWECVQQHFREMGKDIRNEIFTVTGIGDMSGDVFGNGVLLSPTIRLRAAFNHVHVFLDPDPDPAVSFRERERLFRLPRSAWTDYDPQCLSPGGAVIARNAKVAPISPQVRAMLGVDADRLDGEGLIRAVLSMESDLLFNGGIGTYVRASSETNVEVGDAANDHVRVAARDLRATVVAEGGNLGFTQRARIEFAVRGGRINTDAIDNSGGVDLSDHEVNLKILFQPLLESGELSVVQRNRILEQVKSDVIRRVLQHNARQSLLLSLDQLRSRSRLVEFRDHLADLEQEGHLDRTLECLPDREALRSRRSSFLGLTRPELAVLSAYSKLSMQHRIMASPWIDEPALERILFDYFPEPVAERFPEAIRSHRLRREIIATELTNQVIDRMGAAFTQRMLRDSGTDAAAAVAAWVIVVGLTDADRLFDAVATAPIPADAAGELCLRWESAVESSCKFLVVAFPALGSIAERIEKWKKPVAELADLSEGVMSAETMAEIRRIEGMGLSPGLARSLVALQGLRTTLETVRIAEIRGDDLTDAALAYHRVGELLDFSGIERWLESISGDDRWEKRAAEGLREDVAEVRRQMTLAALARSEGDVSARLAGFAAANETELARVRALGEDIRSGRKPSIAGMTVVVRALRRLTVR